MTPGAPNIPEANVTRTDVPIVDAAPMFGGRLLRNLRRWAVAALIFLCVMIVTAWINIPRRAIAWRIEREVAKRGFNLALREVSVLRPWGEAKLEGLVWTLPAGDNGESADSVEIESLTVDGSAFEYLREDIVNVDVLARLLEGQIQSRIEKNKEGTVVRGSANGVPLSWFPKLQTSLQTPVEGNADIIYDLTLPENRIDLLSGSLEIHCTDCAVGDGESRIMFPGATGMAANGVTIPRLHLGQLDARIVFENGEATIESFEWNGDDVKIRASGTIRLREPLKDFRPDVTVKVYFDPKLQSRAETFQLMVKSATKAQLEGPEEGWLGFRWIYYPAKRKAVFVPINSNVLDRINSASNSRSRRASAAQRPARKTGGARFQYNPTARPPAADRAGTDRPVPSPPIQRPPVPTPVEERGTRQEDDEREEEERKDEDESPSRGAPGLPSFSGRPSMRLPEKDLPQRNEPEEHEEREEEPEESQQAEAEPSEEEEAENTESDKTEAEKTEADEEEEDEAKKDDSSDQEESNSSSGDGDE